MSLFRWWNRIASIPARAFMRQVSANLPHRTYAGIELRIAEPGLTPSADRFFERTIRALVSAEERALKAYADLRKDVKQIILWEQTVLWDGGPTPASAPAYQRFQLAAVVPPSVAFELDTRRFAVWLLYTSGLARGTREARTRAEEFLESLPVEERGNVQEWLSTVTTNPP